MLRYSAPDPVPLVTVQAYTESLCIDTKNFIDHNLVPTYHKLGPSVIDLDIVPYGNAEIDQEAQNVTCQHGLAECDANSWQQCAVEAYDPQTYLVFFGCLATSLPMGHKDKPFEEDIFQGCSELSGIDFMRLKGCHDNPELAWLLQEKYAGLTPEHSSVPWVIVDGRLVDVERENFFTAVCKALALKGGSHPACALSLFEMN